MSTALDTLQTALQRALAGQPKVGGFPYLAETLRRAGVTRNSWSLPSCQSLYLLEDGAVVTVGIPLVSEMVEAPPFDREALITALRPLRDRGVRLAIDDAGSGVASLRHILSLAPDVIKLDISLTQGIDTDRSRRALASGLISFGSAVGTHLLGEGVETAAEMAALRELGVPYAQGYYLGRPGPVPS